MPICRSPQTRTWSGRVNAGAFSPTLTALTRRLVRAARRATRAPMACEPVERLVSCIVCIARFVMSVS